MMRMQFRSLIAASAFLMSGYSLMFFPEQTLGDDHDQLNEAFRKQFSRSRDERSATTENGSIAFDGQTRELFIARSTRKYFSWQEIWKLRVDPKGLVITTTDLSREPAGEGLKKKVPLYLSYAVRREERGADDDDGKPEMMLYLSETLEPNSYWKFSVSKLTTGAATVYLSPGSGDYAGWYLSCGKSIAERMVKSKIGPELQSEKSWQVTLTKDKPARAVMFWIDGP